MEKFSDWRDGPTGIAPLLPPRNKPSEDSFIVNLYNDIVFFAFAPLLCFIRIPIIMFLTVVWSIADYVLRNLPFGPITRVLNRICAIICGRIILFLYGFIFLDEAVESLSKSKAPQGSFQSVKLNDVIISNHTSYIDIFYMAYKFSPIFAVPPNDRDELVEGRLVPLSLWFALRNVLFTPVQYYRYSVPTEELLARISDGWEGPLVVFPEGSTSNGLGLLEPSQVFTEPINADRVHVIGITYPPTARASPAFSVGSHIIHSYKICSTFRHEIIVTYLSRNCMPTLPLDGSSRKSVENQDVIEWFDAVFKALSSLTNCRRTKITAHKKLSFNAYWRGYKVNYDGKPSEKKEK